MNPLEKPGALSPAPSAEKENSSPIERGPRPKFEYAIKSEAKEGRAEKGEANQDAVLADPEAGVFGVIDGMGGHAGGDVAARITRECLAANLTADCKDVADMETLMQAALDRANNAVREQQSKNPLFGGMGAAVSAFRVVWDAKNKEQVAVIGHVGDTRIYCITAKGDVRQLTKDATVLNIIHQYTPAQEDVWKQELENIPDTEKDSIFTRIKEGKPVPELSDAARQYLAVGSTLSRAVGHGEKGVAWERMYFRTR